MVQSTSASSLYPASSVLILAQSDGVMSNGKANLWLAEVGKTTGQGFTIKLDDCTRLIAGCQIKNQGKGSVRGRATKEFRVSGSMNENGPWETLVEDQLVDTSGDTAASLLNFTFEQTVEAQFLKFELVSFWGNGGGLQYFAAIPATSKEHQSVQLHVQNRNHVNNPATQSTYPSYHAYKTLFTFQYLECGGPLNPEVVLSNVYNINNYLDTWTTASPTTADYGLAFIIKVDICAILVQLNFNFQFN